MASAATLLRLELAVRNREHARRMGLAHVVSHGPGQVVVYPPAEDGLSHGNFIAESYTAILKNAAWRRRLGKVHAQGKRSLPRDTAPDARKWCELDSSTSSDALLMNVFCFPALLQHGPMAALLNVASSAEPVFGFKARVPRNGATGDATEIDMRLDDLLVEAKLTESNFQRRDVAAVERYRDFDRVFDREALPRAKPRLRVVHDHDLGETLVAVPGQRYESYQMIRNVLAAQALGCRLCVIVDQRRNDLREQYHAVLRAVREAELRTRCMVLTWQELAACCPDAPREFLARKYGLKQR